DRYSGVCLAHHRYPGVEQPVPPSRYSAATVSLEHTPRVETQRRPRRAGARRGRHVHRRTRWTPIGAWHNVVPVRPLRGAVFREGNGWSPGTLMTASVCSGCNRGGSPDISPARNLFGTGSDQLKKPATPRPAAAAVSHHPMQDSTASKTSGARVVLRSSATLFHCSRAF